LGIAFPHLKPCTPIRRLTALIELPIAAPVRRGPKIGKRVFFHPKWPFWVAGVGDGRRNKAADAAGEGLEVGRLPEKERVVWHKVEVGVWYERRLWRGVGEGDGSEAEEDDGEEGGGEMRHLVVSSKHPKP
jgi:hypothetical protein